MPPIPLSPPPPHDPSLSLSHLFLFLCDIHLCVQNLWHPSGCLSCNWYLLENSKIWMLSRRGDDVEIFMIFCTRQMSETIFCNILRNTTKHRKINNIPIETFFNGRHVMSKQTKPERWKFAQAIKHAPTTESQLLNQLSRLKCLM